MQGHLRGDRSRTDVVFVACGRREGVFTCIFTDSLPCLAKSDGAVLELLIESNLLLALLDSSFFWDSACVQETDMLKSTDLNQFSDRTPKALTYV